MYDWNLIMDVLRKAGLKWYGFLPPDR
jgi:hypothetical protein